MTTLLNPNGIRALFAIIMVYVLAAPCAWAQDDGECDIDTVYYDARCQILWEKLYETSGTDDGLLYADSLCSEIGDVYTCDNNRYLQYYVVALSQKLSMLNALSKSNEAIAFADSVMPIFESIGNYEQYWFAHLVKSITHIDQGHYSTAIQIATNMYQASKDSIISIGAEGVASDISLSVNCNSLMLLGQASDAMMEYGKAVGYYSEAIEKLDRAELESSSQEADPASRVVDPRLYLQRLEMQTFRLQASQRFADKEKALAAAERYSIEMLKFNDAQKLNKQLSDIYVGDFAYLLEVAYVNALTSLGRYSEALVHVERADSIFAESGGMAEQYSAEMALAQSVLYDKLGRFDDALECAEHAKKYYTDAQKDPEVVTALKLKLVAMHKLGQYSREFDVAQQIISLSDTVANRRYKSQVADMQMVMDIDKFEKKAKDAEMQALMMETEKQFWTVAAVAVLLCGTLGFMIFKRRKDREKQQILAGQKEELEREVARQTMQLREQNEEIEAQNEALAQINEKIQQQNIEITDSINYALRIQQSILPNLDFFKGFGNGGCFALYVPCHIVSGDFYWARSKPGADIIVCADCTGHGVPGAFMTMIGTTILNDLCDHNEQIDPSEMLESLHENLLNILQQNGEEDSKDGMDLTIAVFEKEKGTVKLASAKRPVFFYRDGVGQEIPDVVVKRSIGERDYNRHNLPFVTVTLDVKEGDMLYLSSDGLADLYGGPKHKRFMKKRQVELQDRISTLSVDEQREESYKAYRDWLTNGGTLPESEWDQLDDVSFIGIRF